MTVAHSVHCVLALPIVLVKEGAGQSSSPGESAGIRGVTEVHHLIHSEEGLEAPLLSFSQLLKKRAIE